MRVVLDTNVLARAHQKARGPARRILLHFLSGSDVLVISPFILGELERVLTYPRLLKRSGLTSNDIAEYLAALCSLVVPEAIQVDVLRDPTDAAIVGTVLAGRQTCCARAMLTYWKKKCSDSVLQTAFR